MTLNRTPLDFASFTRALDSGSSGPAKRCTQMKVLRLMYSSKVSEVLVRVNRSSGSKACWGSSASPEMPLLLLTSPRFLRGVRERLEEAPSPPCRFTLSSSRSDMIEKGGQESRALCTCGAVGSLTSKDQFHCSSHSTSAACWGPSCRPHCSSPCIWPAPLCRPRLSSFWPPFWFSFDSWTGMFLMSWVSMALWLGWHLRSQPVRMRRPSHLVCVLHQVPA